MCQKDPTLKDLRRRKKITGLGDRRATLLQEKVGEDPLGHTALKINPKVFKCSFCDMTIIREL